MLQISRTHLSALSQKQRNKQKSLFCLSTAWILSTDFFITNLHQRMDEHVCVSCKKWSASPQARSWWRALGRWASSRTGRGGGAGSAACRASDKAPVATRHQRKGPGSDSPLVDKTQTWQHNCSSPNTQQTPTNPTVSSIVHQAVQVSV